MPPHLISLAAYLPPSRSQYRMNPQMNDFAKSLAQPRRLRSNSDRNTDGSATPGMLAAVVRKEVVDAVGLGLAGAERDVHALRHASGDAPDLLGVEAELEHVRRLAVPCELGVDGFVGAVVLANDEVGEPAPVAVDERRLVDDVATGA
jgi:hypothetical protein